MTVDFSFEDSELPSRKKTKKKSVTRTNRRSTPRLPSAVAIEVRSYEKDGRVYYYAECPSGHCKHRTPGCLNAVGAQVTMRFHLALHHTKRGRK